jgi:hypothetical protein
MVQGCNIFTLFFKNRVDIGEKESLLRLFPIIVLEQEEPHTLR